MDEFNLTTIDKNRIKRYGILLRDITNLCEVYYLYVDSGTVRTIPYSVIHGKDYEMSDEDYIAQAKEGEE